jgi:putative oxidoreductase
MATQTQYIIPALGKLWQGLDKYAYTFLRIAYGAWYIPHGMQKLFGAFGGGGVSGTAAFFDKIGYSPGILWGTLVGCTEFFGGILLVVGFLTRPIALMFVVFMYVATFHFNIKSGYFWTGRGMEMPLLLLAIGLVILVRGGGEHSLDRKLGREL